MQNPRAFWARVTGRVHSGGGFGHLGLYQHLLHRATVVPDSSCSSAGGT